eukprot:1142091-Pelagomonas_calceolata.AAC.3
MIDTCEWQHGRSIIDRRSHSMITAGQLCCRAIYFPTASPTCLLTILQDPFSGAQGGLVGSAGILGAEERGSLAGVRA